MGNYPPTEGYTNDFKVLEPGMYLCQVKSMADVDDKGDRYSYGGNGPKSGSFYELMVLKVHGTLDKLFVRFDIDMNGNLDTHPVPMSWIRTIREGMGLPLDTAGTTKELVGGWVNVKVANRTNEGKTYNDVKFFSELSAEDKAKISVGTDNTPEEKPLPF